ncbi:MAG: hypothetical protein LBG13_00660 [Holosporales bacterium]|jgi:hypothetical protein|nr:hypothetical protein [Holosporales bacterium]
MKKSVVCALFGVVGICFLACSCYSSNDSIIPYDWDKDGEFCIPHDWSIEVVSGISAQVKQESIEIEEKLRAKIKEAKEKRRTILQSGTSTENS